jgi:nitrite reductase/ring-hydroxylating ferredoxin subunit
MSDGKDTQEASIIHLLVFLVTHSGTYVAQRRLMNEPLARHARESMDDGQTRRSFCSQAVTLTIFGGALGAILDGCSPTAPSNAPPLPIVNGTRVNGGITLAIDASSPLSTVGNAALVQTSVGDFLVARTAQNSFVALAAICTHQTCTITGFDNQNYVCPCHGSTFDVNGRVLGGPAPAALHQYPTQFTSGILTITA